MPKLILWFLGASAAVSIAGFFLDLITEWLIPLIAVVTFYGRKIKENWTMKHTIRGLGIALALGLTAAVTMAQAATLTVSTGSKGGSYHNVLGGNLKRVLSEYDISASLVTSRGSIANLEAVASGAAQLGFTQADALASWMGKNPDKAGSIDILGALGKECVYVAVPEDGKVQEEDDLGQSGINIAVQKQGSGSAVTWEYLATLESTYALANVHYQGGIRALAKLKTGNFDAVLWVTSPENMNHKFLSAVNVEGSGLKILDLNDYSLNNALPDGSSVYEFQTVETTAGWFSSEYEVPCTSVLAVANASMDEENLETLATAVTMHAGRISAK